MGKYKSSDLAVLLIDVQQSFYNHITENEKKSFLESIKEMINICSDRHITLINITYDGYGKILPSIASKLKHTKVIYLPKSSPDAFFETGLHDLLKYKLNKKIIFLAGLDASECVYSTGWSAMDFKFENVVTANNVIADHKDTVKYTSMGKNCSLKEFFTRTGMTFYNTHSEFFNTLRN